MKMHFNINIKGNFLIGLFALGITLGTWFAPLGAVAEEISQQSEPEIQVQDEEIEGLVQYKAGEGLHLGKHLTLFGYGEIHYNDPIGTSDGDQFDFHRFVIGLGVQFTDWLVLNSEVEFEHGGEEVELEQAYLDFLFLPEANLRAGVVLTPVGFLNHYHDPNLFYSVERPLYNTIVIPTTWFGAGAGAHGQTDFGLEYAAYAMESLDATGFTGSSGLRGGRGKTAEAPGSDVAGVVRLAYAGVPGLQIGTSAWFGNTGQSDPAIGGAFTTIVEGDVRYHIEGVELTFAGSWIFIDDAGQINQVLQAQNPAFTDFVASQIVGGYAELPYHIFHHLWETAPVDIVVYGRHERVNTQHKMPAGFISDPANNQRRTTVGLALFPIEQVAIKFDYSFNRNDADTAHDQFDAGVAFVF